MLAATRARFAGGTENREGLPMDDKWDDNSLNAEIGRLHHRYFHSLDSRDRSALTSCFAPDAAATYLGGTWVLDGREAIVQQLMVVARFDATIHVPSTWSVDRDNNNITGVVYAVAYIRTAVNVPEPRMLVRGLRYRDSFRRIDGTLVIASRAQDELWQFEAAQVPPQVYLP